MSERQARWFLCLCSCLLFGHICCIFSWLLKIFILFRCSKYSDWAVGGFCFAYAPGVWNCPPLKDVKAPPTCFGHKKYPYPNRFTELHMHSLVIFENFFSLQPFALRFPCLVCLSLANKRVVFPFWILVPYIDWYT